MIFVTLRGAVASKKIFDNASSTYLCDGARLICLKFSEFFSASTKSYAESRVVSFILTVGILHSDGQNFAFGLILYFLVSGIQNLKH